MDWFLPWWFFWEYALIFFGGCSLIFLGIKYLVQVCRTSKSPFALKVMAFTVGFGVQQVLTVVCSFTMVYFYWEESIRITDTVSATLISLQFLWLLLQLQTWEFAAKYLESAMKCYQRPCISLENIQRVRIAVEVLFTIVVLSGSTFYLVLWEKIKNWFLPGFYKVWWDLPYEPVI
jgi:hypothetical protein